MKKQNIKLWRNNFEIKRVSFFLGHEAMEAFYFFQHLIAGKRFLNEVIWIQKDKDNLGTYFVKNELRALVDKTLEVIINKTDKVKKVHKMTINNVIKAIKNHKQVFKTDLKKLSDKQLVNLYKKNYNFVQLAHGPSLPSTWFVDSDGEDLTNHLLNYAKNQVDKLNLKINFAQAFSILTTPSRFTFAQIEAKELLRILKLIKADKIAKEIFLNKNVKKIENSLDKINPGLRKKIFNHHKKWCWTPYTYIGPVYDLDYYLEVWSGLLRQKMDVNNELKKLERINQKTKIKRDRLFKQLKIDSRYRKIFNIAAEIVWLKAYRKDEMFLACYVIDKIYKEMGRRLGLSLNQVRYLTHFEIEKAILKNKFSVDEINRRSKFLVMYSKKGKSAVFTGKKAKSFLAKQNFEKVKIKDIKDLKGTPACPGKAKGAVKRIDVPDDMEKMKQGDIMVSHSTFPSLVPAMKKAKAIITEDGGLTCHAAIVARELKKPCIVGIKMITQVLKDGDKVEVDANNGIVRKLS